MMMKFYKKQKGMTMIELVIVLIVIGIVSGVSAMKYGSSSSLTISQQTQMFANHIRQMQALSLNWGCNLKMLVTASGYSVTANTDYSGTDKATNCKDGVSLIKTPGRFEDFNFSLDHDVTFSGTGILYLDDTGQPSTATPTTAKTTNTDFQMTENGNNFRIRILPVSGFVEISKI